RHLLDGQPIAAGDRLDLTRLTPGRHRWEAVAERPGAPPVRSDAELVIVPGLDLVEQAVADFLAGREIPADLSLSTRQEMGSVREQVRAGRTDLARQALRKVLRALEDPRIEVPERLIHQIRYLDLFGRLEPEVAMGESGCTPADIVVEVGDAVRWRHPAKAAQAAKGEIRLAATDGSFFSPAISSGTWSRTFDQEGKVEYLCGTSRGTLSVEPRKADVRETAMRGPGRVPTVLAIDKDLSVWFSAGGGGYASLASIPLNNVVGRVRRNGEVEEFRTPTPESAPTSIKVAPDGTIWFTERAANKIGRLDPATGTITEFDVPTERSAPTGIAVAPDGGVWFTEKMAGKIGRFDPESRTFTEYPTPTPKAEPSTVVLDAEGYVWFDERGADTLNRMDPKTGEVTSFKVPTQGSRVIGLVPDPRGYMWFLELAGHKVGRLEVATGQIVEYTIPTKLASPFKAALDRHGRLWFTQAYGNKIGLLQGERFFELALPREASMPGGIEITPEGHVWFTQQAADIIGYIPFAAEIFSPPDSGLIEEARPEG
ncbi:MAG TPA: hypothetical protein VL025_08220, partial [Thermoanaerobaculia bacterium]|nr:hypothetical protein [Thermoanaerobaculia bacterium]